MTQVLIVTGASRDPGIGSAVAKLALARNWQVVINGRREPNWRNDGVIFVPGDITKESTQQEVIDTAVNKWGRIDAVVHNAALTHSAADPTAADWIQEYNISVVAPYQLSLMAKPWLEQTQGAVVMIGSRSGARPYVANSIAYGVAKSAQHTLAQELAVRFAPVRVNAVAPGLTLSARQLEKWQNPEWKATITTRWQSQSLLPGYIEVDQVAESVLYLLTAKNVTGTVLEINNGVNI
jgi:NAD(P)-dependent dehydrogenase (short-subunit alcohol dehydrogenase family)